MKIDKFTYGDSKAAIKLADIVEKNEEHCHHLSVKVGRIYNDFNCGLTTLAHMEVEEAFREQLISMWHENAKIRVEDATLPESVKTFLRNVISTQFKKTRKGLKRDAKCN